MKKLFITILIGTLFATHLDGMDTKEQPKKTFPIPIGGKPPAFPQKVSQTPGPGSSSSSSFGREWPRELIYSTELGSSTDFSFTSPNQTPNPTPVSSPRGPAPEKEINCCKMCLKRIFCCLCCWCCAKRKYNDILAQGYEVIKQ